MGAMGRRVQCTGPPTSVYGGCTARPPRGLNMFLMALTLHMHIVWDALIAAATQFVIVLAAAAGHKAGHALIECYVVADVQCECEYGCGWAPGRVRRIRCVLAARVLGAARRRRPAIRTGFHFLTSGGHESGTFPLPPILL